MFAFVNTSSYVYKSDKNHRIKNTTFILCDGVAYPNSGDHILKYLKDCKSIKHISLTNNSPYYPLIKTNVNPNLNLRGFKKKRMI